MEKNTQRTFRVFIKNMGQILSLSRLYNFEHRVFKEKANQVLTDINNFFRDSKQPISISETGKLFLVNGEKIEIQDNLGKRFLEAFLNLKLGSLDLEPGITMDEFIFLIHVLNQTEHLQGEAQIKEYLKKHGATHVIPRFASYKLVREDEKIVRNGGVINIDELPPGLMEKFSSDLNSGDISTKLQKAEKEYSILAHNPQFLSNIVSGKVENNPTSDEFSKVLWLIGDYLIQEVTTVREEEINRKVLEEIKDHLLKLWEKKEDKSRWKSDMQKTFDTISTALELKGFILLYAKHKKELDKVSNKIKKILDILPQDSNLYKKTKEDLEKMGFVF